MVDGLSLGPEVGMVEGETLGTSLGLLRGDAEGSDDETIVGIKPVQPTVSVQPLGRPFRQAILVSCVEQILRLLICNLLLH